MSEFPLCERAGLMPTTYLRESETINIGSMKMSAIEPVVPAKDVERLLANAPVVYGEVKADRATVYSTAPGPEYDTHTARLLLIEPLVKESEEVQLLRSLIQWDDDGDVNINMICSDVKAFLRKLDADKERG